MINRRTFLVKLIQILFGLNCYVGVSPLTAAEKNVGDKHNDDLVIVNGWIVKRSQTTKHIRNITDDL